MTNIIDWKSALDQCRYDIAVGIKIAKLSGDANFSTYLTSIDPGKSVNPHYHKHGEEHYHIIEGAGEIVLTDVISKVSTTISLRANNSLVVSANTLHQLRNTANVPLVLMFSCPESHLDKDRYLLDQL